jgi:hypothetical protein
MENAWRMCNGNQAGAVSPTTIQLLGINVIELDSMQLPCRFGQRLPELTLALHWQFGKRLGESTKEQNPGHKGFVTSRRRSHRGGVSDFLSLFASKGMLGFESPGNIR